MKIIRFLGLVLVLQLFCSTASSNTVLDIQGGTLFGAFRVDVNSVLYDVQFKDGTCIELYNGCDENTDFPFTNPADLNDGLLLGTAMQALLDQVFVDSSLGAFDTTPNLMNGCNVPGGCNIATPLWVSGAGGLGVFVAQNWKPEHRDDVGSGGGGFNTGDTRPRLGPGGSGFLEDIKVYAVWNQSSVSEVPIPAAVWLFGSGLIGLIGMRKKSSKISTRSA